MVPCCGVKATVLKTKLAKIGHKLLTESTNLGMTESPDHPTVRRYRYQVPQQKDLITGSLLKCIDPNPRAYFQNNYWIVESSSTPLPRLQPGQPQPLENVSLRCVRSCFFFILSIKIQHLFPKSFLRVT